MNKNSRPLPDLPLFAAAARTFSQAAPKMSELSDAHVLGMALWPVADAGRIAAELVERHGTIAAVLAQPAGELAGAVGKDAAAQLAAVREAALRMVRVEAVERVRLDRFDLLENYLRARLGREPREHFLALFLDVKNRLIAEEIMSVGTINHCAVYPREIVRRALELNAAAMAISHNHPSGDPTPSRADIEMTKEIVAALKTIGVAVHDHIIATSGECRSFRALGLL